MALCFLNTYKNASFNDSFSFSIRVTIAGNSTLTEGSSLIFSIPGYARVNSPTLSILVALIFGMTISFAIR